MQSRRVGVRCIRSAATVWSFEVSRRLKKYLYCPVEVGTRELSARCLTAFIAAEAGFEVLIGYHYTLLEHTHSLPQGIYLFKGTNALAVTNMAGVRSMGHSVLSFEEENFFRSLQGNPINYHNAGLPDVCDYYLAMGKDEEDALRHHFGKAIKSVRCGNARTDILRPEMKQLHQQNVDALKSKFGPFILVNSNIGVLNSVSGASPQEQFQRWQDMGLFVPDLPLKDRQNIFDDYMVLERDNLECLKAFLKLQSGRNVTVIMRPHPGENIAFWQNFVADLGTHNIHVTGEGSHIPMILAAELLVHAGCTTGVEALLLDVPTLSMTSSAAKASSYYLSNKFNASCTSAEEAVRQVELYMAGEQDLNKDRSKFLAGMASYLEGLESGPLASEMIVDFVSEFYATQWGERSNAVEDVNREIKIWREHEQYTSNEYNRRKYGSNPMVVEETLGQFKRAFGRFEDINCERLSETVYRISAL
jgi:surface carbohydrate biosynthesis protein